MSSAARIEKRYDHLTIVLKNRATEKWEPVKALDWNGNGFNFYSAYEIPGAEVSFKKGSARFEGSIAWRHRNDDDGVILEMALNEMLFEKIKTLGQLKKLPDNNEGIRDIIELIRDKGKSVEKRKILAFFGITLSDRDLEEMVGSYKKFHPMYRYGIRMDTEEWRKIVASEMPLSS